jgi:DNA-directed RNA polymerase specialized sigma24 family protein
MKTNHRFLIGSWQSRSRKGYLALVIKGSLWSTMCNLLTRDITLAVEASRVVNNSSPILAKPVSPPPEAQALLAAYLQAETEAEAEHALAQLIAQHSTPLIKEIIGYKLRFATARPGSSDEQQREDVYHDALVRLLTRLRACRANPRERAINDLHALTAVIAYRACYTYLRRKYARRHLLKNRLRYLLSHQSGLALWEVPGQEVIAGYAAWRGAEASGRAVERLARVAADAAGCLPTETLTQECATRRPAELLAAVFDFVGGPVVLDDLVNLVVVLWDVHEETVEEALEELPDRRPDTACELEQREFLRELWAEVLQLPVRQRCALLLNLRDADGAGCIALLPLTGIATLRQIAAALELPDKELAALWRRLPLEDAALAEYLALTRQQVINLRKSARARLARRLKNFL